MTYYLSFQRTGICRYSRGRTEDDAREDAMLAARAVDDNVRVLDETLRPIGEAYIANGGVYYRRIPVSGSEDAPL